MAVPTSSYSTNVTLAKVSGSSTINKVQKWPKALSAYGSDANFKSVFRVDEVLDLQDSTGTPCVVGLVKKNPVSSNEILNASLRKADRIGKLRANISGSDYILLNDGGLNTKALVSIKSIPKAATNELQVSFSYVNAYYLNSTCVSASISCSNGNSSVATTNGFSLVSRSAGSYNASFTNLPAGIAAGQTVGVVLSIQNEEGRYDEQVKMTATVTSSAPYYNFTWGDSTTTKTVNIAAAGGALASQSVISTKNYGANNIGFRITSIPEMFDNCDFVANTSSRYISGYIDSNCRYNTGKTGSLTITQYDGSTSIGNTITLKVQQAKRTYTRREITVMFYNMPAPTYYITTYVNKYTPDVCSSGEGTGDGSDSSAAIMIPNTGEADDGQGGYIMIEPSAYQNIGSVWVDGESYTYNERIFVPNYVDEVQVRRQ